MRKIILIGLLITVFNISKVLGAPTPAVLNTLNSTGKCIGCTLDGLQMSQLKAGLVITDLSNSSIQNANLPGINLTGANLTNSNWMGTNLTGANLSNANLTNIILGNETYIGNQLAPGANLTNANLSNVTMSKSFISNCNLTNALISTKTIDGYFDGSTFGPCTMIVAATAHNTMLASVALQGNIYIQNASGLNVGNSTVNGQPLTLNSTPPAINITSSSCSNFANLATIQASLGIGPVATLNNTGKCIGCTLDGLQMSQLKSGLVITDLSNSSIQNANLPGINLTGANLTNSNWMGTNLTGANLSNANLTNIILGNETGANLTNANLSNVTMSKSFISNCNLTNALISTKTIDGYFDGSTFGPCTMIVAATAHNTMLASVALQGNIYIQNASGLNVGNSTVNGQPLTLNSTPPVINITSPSCSNFANLATIQASLGIVTPLSALNSTGICKNCNLNNLQMASLKAGLQITSLDGSSLRGANLTGINLSNVNSFTSVDFTGANLTNANFNNPNGLTITNGSFNGANLTGAQMQNVTITGTDFTGANLTGAVLSSSAITNAKFDNAVFGSVKVGTACTTFIAASMAGGSLNTTLHGNVLIVSTGTTGVATSNSSYSALTKANSTAPLVIHECLNDEAYCQIATNPILPTYTTVDSNIENVSGCYNNTADPFTSALNELNSTGKCPNCTLVGMTINDINLAPGVNITSFNGADLSGVDFSNQNLTGIDFTGSNLSGANLSGVKANGVQFVKASLYDANLSKGNFLGANFTGAGLGGVNLTGAILAESTLTNLVESMTSDFTYTNSSNQLVTKSANTYIDLRGNQTLAEVSFDGANMVGINLSGANLSWANFALANLTNSTIAGANVSNAMFLRANLTGTNCTGVDFSSATIDYNTTIFTNANLTNAVFSTQLNLANFGNVTSVGINIPSFPSGIYENMTINGPVRLGFENYSFTNVNFVSTATNPIQPSLLHEITNNPGMYPNIIMKNCTVTENGETGTIYEYN